MHRIDIGIDGGGTRTRLGARSASGDRFTAEGTGSNPRVIGAEACADMVSGLIHEALGDRIADASIFLCAGIAGASTDDMQEALSAGIRRGLTAASSVVVKVTDDATISFEAAFAGNPGTLLLLGTGSNIICKTNGGRQIHSGGWGYLIGDEGSGFAIGRLGLRAVARAMDRGLETSLSSRAVRDLGLDERAKFLAAIYGGSLHVADFAQVVLDEASRGDIESKRLVSEAVSALVDDLAATVEAASSELPRTIRVVGGLSRSSVYMQELRAAIAVRLGDNWQVGPSERTPLEGALWIASRLTE